jgi:teichuronic acid exporter
LRITCPDLADRIDADQRGHPVERSRASWGACLSADGPEGHAPRTHLDEVMHGLRWIGTARIFTQFVTWSLTIVTVRLLEPRDYGIVATSGLFTILAMQLMDGGLGAVLVSRRDLSIRIYGAAVTAVLLVSLVLAGVIIAVAPLGAHLFNNTALTNVLRVGSICLPLAALSVIPSALLAKAFKFRQLALAQAGSSLLQGLATLAMAWSGAAYWALIIGTLFGSAVRAAFLWLSLQDRPKPSCDFVALRSLWRSGTQMVGQRIVFFVAQDFDIFLLGRLGGPTVLGSYSLAKTLSHSLLDQLAAIVNQVSTPIFAAKADDSRAQLHGFLLMISTVSALVFPLFWLGCVLSRPALPLVFGNRWAPTVIPFMAFMFVLPFRSVFSLLDWAVIGTGRVSTTLRNMLTWAAVMMPILFIAAHFGANWLAVSWCVGFPIVFILSMRRIARALQVRLGQILKPMRAPLICSLASAVVVEVALAHAAPFLPLAAQLALGVVLGGACYVLLMRQYARQDFDKAWYLAVRLVRGRG